MNKFVIVFALLGLNIFPLSAGAAENKPVVEVYKNPNCGCCKQWIAHLEQNGFVVKAHDVVDVNASRQALGMPQYLGACHTAKVNGYLVEGHVPAADIRRLLRDKPRALGLAVPGMPQGSPGMESLFPQHYDTLLVRNDGSAQVYAKH